MVKGRRVRAVVACTNAADCCSPHPKRRGPTRPPTITDFFQSVELNGAKPELDLIVPGDFYPTNKHDDESVIEISTPIKPIAIKTATPHRIEQVVPKPSKDGATGAAAPPTGKKLTDYFPVRRSVRKTKKTVLEEKQRSLEQMVRNGGEDGLLVKYFDDKGRGVVASKAFAKGDFVVEYRGDLIDLNEAKRREEQYAEDKYAGCYMYYFKHNNQQYCVDATAESGKIGRLVNHSRNGNLITRTIMVDSQPRLVLIAKDDVKIGEELTYDYGDRSKESLRHHPWLAY